MIFGVALLILVPSISLTVGKFNVHHDPMSWSEAQSVCAENGGELLRDLNHEDVGDFLVNITSPVWQGKYYTPWVWIYGCYYLKNSIELKGTEFKNNRMKVCQNHCANSNYFGLQGNSCICLENVEGRYVNTADRCPQRCPGNTVERCGGRYALSVYMNDICHKNTWEWKGTISTTWSGKKCLPWANVTTIQRATLYFPDGSLENASNYCRDPTKRSYIWCYINQTSVGRCDIPQCIREDRGTEYPCMSFKKSGTEYQFMQESCDSIRSSICTSDTSIFWSYSDGNFTQAIEESARYRHSSDDRCRSIAGPRIFWISADTNIDKFHWFGYYREISTINDTVPASKPTKCFTSYGDDKQVSGVEDCSNKHAFICQYAAVNYGEIYNNSLTGIFESPGYNTSNGYAASERYVWKISVPESYTISLSLNISIEDSYRCRNDFVNVYEGRYSEGDRLCGEVTETINITGNEVTVEFRSDNSVGGRGARIDWRAVPISISTTPSPPTRQTSTYSVSTEGSDGNPNVTEDAFDTNEVNVNNEEGLSLESSTIIGIVIGALFCVGLIAGILCFVTRRKITPKKQKHVCNTVQVGEKAEKSNSPETGEKMNKCTRTRPGSEIYQNADYTADATSDNAQYDLTNDVLNANRTEDTVIINGVDVQYHPMESIGRQGDASNVYNTLNEKTESIYQNQTENAYNSFTDVQDVYNHIGVVTENKLATVDAKTYDHLSEGIDIYDRTTRKPFQGVDSNVKSSNCEYTGLNLYQRE